MLAAAPVSEYLKKHNPPFKSFTDYVPTLRPTTATDLTGSKGGLKLPWQTRPEQWWRERSHPRQWTMISASIDTALPDTQAEEHLGALRVSAEPWLFFLGGEMIR